jgi:hypothetical protein
MTAIICINAVNTLYPAGAAEASPVCVVKLIGFYKIYLRHIFNEPDWQMRSFFQ